MKLYADLPARRARQLTGDLLLLCWVWLWVSVGGAVRDATLALARPADDLAGASAGLAERLREAGAGVGEVPLVGDEVRVPFDGAGEAADRIAAAGSSQATALTELATLLGLVVIVVPVALALMLYLPARVRFVRHASAGRRFVDSGSDLDLFALRAMARQPLHRLARISDDPVGAWRAGDPRVLRALAELELRAAGLAPPGSAR